MKQTSAPGTEITSFSQAQKEYITKRVDSFVCAIQGRLRAHNPLLNLAATIDLSEQNLTLRIVAPGNTKYGVRTVATLKGKFHLFWHHGKRLHFDLPAVGKYGAIALPLHRRVGLSAPDAFARVESYLPSREETPVKKSDLEKRKPRIKTHDHQPAVHAPTLHKKRIRAKNARKLLTNYEPHHVRFIAGRVEELEKVFKDRLKKVFNDVSIDYSIDMHEANHGKAKMNVRLRPKNKHHVRGTPQEIWIQGELSLRWHESRSKHTRLDFTPTHGLSSKNNTYKGINLSRKSADVVREIYNLVVANRLIVNTSKKNQKETAGANDNTARDKKPKKGQTRFHRIHSSRREGNGGNFAAQVKSGTYPG